MHYESNAFRQMYNETDINSLFRRLDGCDQFYTILISLCRNVFYKDIKDVSFSVKIIFGFSPYLTVVYDEK